MIYGDSHRTTRALFQSACCYRPPANTLSAMNSTQWPHWMSTCQQLANCNAGAWIRDAYLPITLCGARTGTFHFERHHDWLRPLYSRTARLRLTCWTMPHGCGPCAVPSRRCCNPATAESRSPVRGTQRCSPFSSAPATSEPIPSGAFERVLCYLSPRYCEMELRRKCS